MIAHAVLVSESFHIVSVHQRSKTVWIAAGDYRGERIEAKGASQRSAIAHWWDAARHSGS
jgi:hypothetical protein